MDKLEKRVKSVAEQVFDCEANEVFEPVMVSKGFISFVRQITWLSAMGHGWGNGYVICDKSTNIYKRFVRSREHSEYNPIFEGLDAHKGLTFASLGEDTLVIGFATVHAGDSSRITKERVVDLTKMLHNSVIELENKLETNLIKWIFKKIFN